jgi:hypothetical protein
MRSRGPNIGCDTPRSAADRRALLTTCGPDRGIEETASLCATYHARALRHCGPWRASWQCAV